MYTFTNRNEIIREGEKEIFLEENVNVYKSVNLIKKRKNSEKGEK